MRVLRRGCAALAATVAILAATTFGAPAARAETPGSQTAAERFAACVAGEGSADVLILLDESGSLRETDDANTRVTAAKFLLRRLADLTEDGAKIAVRLSSFGTDYKATTDWIGLSHDSLPKVLDKADAFRDLKWASGTDYWLGLDGARKNLKDQRAQNSHACQAIVFFSDGHLDIVPAAWEGDFGGIGRPYAEHNPLRTAEDRAAATRAAAASLCRKGGLADQIRKQGVIVFGIGLAPDGDKGQFDLMRSVVTGKDDCGAISDPVPGDFTMAGDIDDLLFAFDEASGGARTQSKAPVCQGSVCAEGAYRVVLDPTISRVDVLGSADVDGIEVFLTAPDGKQAKLPHGDVGKDQPIPVDGVSGTFAWQSDHTVSLRWNAAAGSQWDGQWQIAFVDPAKESSGEHSRTSIEVKGNLVPALASPLQDVRQDTPVDLGLGVVDSSGAPVSLADSKAQVTMDAQIEFANGETRQLAGGIDKSTFGDPLHLDAAGYPLGKADLMLTLHITTAGTTVGGKPVPGTELAPAAVTLPLTVLPPANFPTVADALDFGLLDGVSSATAAMPVQGPGCVWLDPAATTVDAAPDEAGTITVSSPNQSAETCLRVEQGATGQLPVQLQAATSGNGAVAGTLTVKLAAADDVTLTREAPVSYSAELARPLNPVNFWLALTIALVLGLGLPLGLVYLLKYVLNSRIPSGLNVASVQVAAEDGGLRRTDGPLELRTGEIKMLDVRPGGQRSVTFDGVRLLSRLGASPFGAASVEVGGPGLRSAAPGWVPGPKPARLPLSLAGSWAVVKGPEHTAGHAKLLVFFAASAPADKRQKVLDRARDGAADLIAELDAAASPADHPRPPDNPLGDDTSRPAGGASPLADNPFAD
jgi:hypothetical protein